MKVRLLLCSALIIYLAIVYDLDYNYIIIKSNNFNFKISFAISACIIIALSTMILLFNNFIRWGPKSIKKWQLKKDIKTLKNLIKAYQHTISSSLNLETIKPSKYADELLLTWLNNYNQGLLAIRNNNNYLDFYKPALESHTNDLQTILYLKNITSAEEFIINFYKICSQKKLSLLYKKHPKLTISLLKKAFLFGNEGLKIWSLCSKDLQNNPEVSIAYLNNLNKHKNLSQNDNLKMLKNTKEDEVKMTLSKIYPEAEIKKAINFLQNNQNSPTSQIALARLYVKNNQHNLAISIYEKQIEFINKDRTLWIELANLYLTTGQYKQATKWLNSYQETA